MLDISAIILTFNEELHIGRCLDNVCQIAKEVFVIDSFSTDRTIEIARQYPSVTVLQNKWENSYAKQLNWALDNAPISGRWILRLDADEYMTPELIDELKLKLPAAPADVSGYTFNLRRIFMDKWLKRGIYPIKLLRLFRNGCGRCEQRLMDEHIELTSGLTVELENDFCDHNLNNLSWFCQKHVGYAAREAADLLDIEFDLSGKASASHIAGINRQAAAKRKKKLAYARKPLFWRSTAYFIYRYFLKGAWREGKEGFIFTFIQGWWYRTLVDAKVYEIKRKCGNDRDKIVNLLQNEYNITFSSPNRATITGGVISCIPIFYTDKERRAA